MKKLGVILLLAMFIIGMMPAAFAAKGPAVALGGAKIVSTAAADEDVAIPNEEEIAAEPDEDTKMELCMAKVKELRPKMAEDRVRTLCRTRFLQQNAGRLVDKAKVIGQDAQRINMKLQEFRQVRSKEAFNKFDKAKNFRARVIDKAKLAKAKVNYAKAKKDFFEAKEKLGRAKIRLEGAKNIRQSCEDPESEECAAAKEELRAAAKEHFTNQADIIIRHLEQIKSRAESSEVISEERAEKIISWADEKIAAFEAIKAEIEAAEDKAAILEAAKNLRDEWKDIKQDARSYVGRIVNSRIGGIIVKSKMLEVKLDRTLERMEANGKDTSEIQPLVDEFHAKIEAASVAYEEAMGHFDEAAETTGAERSTHINAAQASMKDAKKALQEATKILRDIIRQVRQQGATELQEASEEVEEQVEAEEETEVEEEAEAEEEEEEEEEEETEEETGNESSGVAAAE